MNDSLEATIGCFSGLLGMETTAARARNNLEQHIRQYHRKDETAQ